MIKLCAFADEASPAVVGQTDALRENGIGLLEVRGVDEQNISEISPTQTRELRRILDDNGIGAWSIGSPIGKYPLDADIEPHLDAYRDILEKAQILGASRIRLFSFYPTEGEAEEETAKKTLERLHRICELTPDGIVPCHENEKAIFGDTVAHCLQIHRALPKLRAVFDPANFVQCGIDPLTAWDALSEYVDYIHIKDACATDGGVVPAGQGDGHLPEIIRRYLAGGGEVMTLEPHLMEFVGLANLENGESLKHAVTFRNNREAFDVAANALKHILSTLSF